MPMELHQLSPLPQSHDEAQPCLEQTQSRSADIIDELVLARGNHMRAPQQQPGVDQCQGQQQPLQALGMAHPGQLQAKAAPVIFEILEQFFNPEPLLVTATGTPAGRFRGDQIPRLASRGRPVHGQIEATGRMFLREGHVGPETALAWQHQGQRLKIGAPAWQTYSWARSRRQTPQPWCSAHWASTPVPNSRSPSKSTSARGGSHRATTANNSFCSAKLDAPGPSIPHSRGKARPRHPTQTYKRLKSLHSVRSTVKCIRAPPPASRCKMRRASGA